MKRGSHSSEQIMSWIFSGNIEEGCLTIATDTYKRETILGTIKLAPITKQLEGTVKKGSAKEHYKLEQSIIEQMKRM